MDGVSVGGGRAFAFDPDPPAPPEQQQIELRTVVRGPVISVVWLQRFEDFFDRISFPRRADFRVMLQVPLIRDPEQYHENPAANAGISWCPVGNATCNPSVD